MKITAFIPARGGSKSIPKKNILPLNGHPLIAYTIAVAKMSRFIDDVIVSTDCEEIADISRKYGAKVIMQPPEISTDRSHDILVFKYFLEHYQKHKFNIPDYMVHLRATTPLRLVNIVDQGIEFILNKPQATSMRSAHSSSITPFKVFKMQDNYFKGFFPELEPHEYYNEQRQVYPETYIPNGYVDVIKPSVIFQTKTLHGKDILGFVTPPVPDIDSPRDYEYAKNELIANPDYQITNYIKNYE